MRVISTLRFPNTFHSARQLNRNFAGLRQFSTPSKKEVVSRINVLVLNAGVKSVKYGLFSIASRPAGHDWLQKDSVLLSSGRQTAVSYSILLIKKYASFVCGVRFFPKGIASPLTLAGLIDHVGDGDAPSIVTAHVLGRSTVSVLSPSAASIPPTSALQADAALTHPQYTAVKRIKDSGAAFVEIVSLLTDPKQGPISTMKDIAVVGHRVVHGGPMSKAMVIDAKVRPAAPRRGLLLPPFPPPLPPFIPTPCIRTAPSLPQPMPLPPARRRG
jgi:hypothetical protein